MSDLNHSLKQRHRSRLASTADRLNCRLRRVCSLLVEPASVATPSPFSPPTRLDRMIKLHYARTLEALNREHDANVFAYVDGELDKVDHRDLEDMFLLRHRDLMRAVAVVSM